YFDKGNLKSSELLESNSPVKLLLLEPNHLKLDSISYSFTIIESGGKFKIKDNKGTRDYILGQKITSHIGLITLVPQGKKSFGGELMIIYRPIEKAVDRLLTNLQVTPNKDKQSFIVNFSIDQPNRDKGALILNSVIDQYNNDVTEDKTK